MKKYVLLLTLAGTLIVLLSPGLVGRLAEQAIAENRERIMREIHGITVRSEHDERRWFKSQGRQRIAFSDPELESKFREILMTLNADAEAPELLVDTRTDYGPIPLTSMAREHGSLAPALARSVSTLSYKSGDADPRPLPMTIVSKIDFGGTLSGDLRIESGSSTVEGDVASWSEVNLAFDVGPSGGGFELTVDSIEAGDADARVALGPIAMAGHAEASGEDVDLSFGASVHLAEIPGVDTRRIDFETSLDGINGEALDSLRDVIDTVGPGADDAVLEAATEDAILAMLAAGLEFRVDKLDIEFPDGQTEARLSITMTESDAVDYDWSSALEAMVCDADLSVSATAVETAMTRNEAVVAAVGSGFLKRDETVYRMRLKCSNGLMTVNGAPMPLRGLIP